MLTIYRYVLLLQPAMIVPPNVMGQSVAAVPGQTMGGMPSVGGLMYGVPQANPSLPQQVQQVCIS